jgi:ATP-dependent helicase/nuclease subunit A
LDEFQDTSPIQLAVFSVLAGLVRETFWVGGSRQAIYGFRGTDSQLMAHAIQSLPPPAREEILDVSYRSRPDLVELVNRHFVPAFASHGLSEEQVRLKPARATTRLTGPAIEHCQLPERRGT